jgi:fatty acid desaturase
VNEDRLFEKLERIEAHGIETVQRLARLEEQAKDVPDHESRIRLLERWKYGLPIAGLTAVLSAGVSAWTASKGT